MRDRNSECQLLFHLLVKCAERKESCERELSDLRQCVTGLSHRWKPMDGKGVEGPSEIVVSRSCRNALRILSCCHAETPTCASAAKVASLCVPNHPSHDAKDPTEECQKAIVAIRRCNGFSPECASAAHVLMNCTPANDDQTNARSRSQRHSSSGNTLVKAPANRADGEEVEVRSARSLISRAVQRQLNGCRKML